MRRPAGLAATDIAFWEPGTGSHSRIVQVCRLLATRVDLTVLVFRKIDEAARAQIEAARYSFEVVSFSTFADEAGRIAIVAATRVETHLRRWFVPEWQQAFRAAVDRLRPSVVMIEYVRLAYLVEEIGPGIVTLLDSHDVMSARSISFLAFGLEPSIGLSVEAEISLLRRFDFVLAISTPDQAWLRRFMRPASVVLVPFTTAAEPLAPLPSGHGPTDRLVFAGTNAPANVRGLRWFVEFVWPYLRDMRLVVFGEVGKSVPRDPRIEIRGVVDSTDEIYEEYGVALNPVFVGGGLKIKSLEAISTGLPLVASREGLRGLENFVGEGVALARSRAEFISAVRAQAAAAHTPATLRELRGTAMETLREQAEAHGFLAVLERLASGSSARPVA